MSDATEQLLFDGFVIFILIAAALAAASIATIYLLGNASHIRDAEIRRYDLRVSRGRFVLDGREMGKAAAEDAMDAADNA